MYSLFVVVCFVFRPQSVKSWGTEGRVDGEQIPASTNLHDCVNFRGEDIKDLHVHEVKRVFFITPGAPFQEAIS